MVQFDPVVYGPITEGVQQSVAFRIVATPPPAAEITVLFSTIDGTAIGTSYLQNYDKNGQ